MVKVGLMRMNNYGKWRVKMKKVVNHWC